MFSEFINQQINSPSVFMCSNKSLQYISKSLVNFALFKNKKSSNVNGQFLFKTCCNGTFKAPVSLSWINQSFAKFSICAWPRCSEESKESLIKAVAFLYPPQTKSGGGGI